MNFLRNPAFLALFAAAPCETAIDCTIRSFRTTTVN
jgi:hypothetical protein